MEAHPQPIDNLQEDNRDLVQTDELRPPHSPLEDSEPELCEEQVDLSNGILEGGSHFVTGSAGRGKSTVLKYVDKRLAEKNKVVVKVAMTCKAAHGIGGSTIHSLFGWTSDASSTPIQDLIIRGKRKSIVRMRLRKMDVLIIDEISMVSNFDLERINALLRAARNNDRPFGGVQIHPCNGRLLSTAASQTF